MNKKKVEIKKTLVRNAKQKVPQIKIVNEFLKDAVDAVVIEKDKPSHQNIQEKQKQYLDLSLPSANTTKQLSKQISALKIKNTAKTTKKCDEGITEKITKRMNFRMDEKIFKDLIPLHVEKPFEKQSPQEYKAQSVKDQEPNLEDFIKKKKQKDYFYEVSPARKEISFQHEYDGFKMYNILQNW